MVELRALSIPDKDSDDGWERLLPFVPPEKRERIRRFARPADARRTLAGELLVRAGLMRRYGLANRDIRFRLGAHGKPELETPGRDHFNVSHSGAWVVAAFSKVGPVGVDVERIRPVDMALARRFFSADECEALLALAGAEQTALFFRYWTLKESYLKALGSGLSKPLSSFSIRFDGDAIALHEGGRRLSGFAFRSYDLDAGHKLALCATEPGLPSAPDLCDWSTLGRAFDPARDAL
jgi:4'-phosphopantetheinyl transferase